jgi:Tfp pilus assembly pilus retraction ATPase PilT
MPSFAQGLLDAMRENPDVIVVGELRESDTMQIALSAAESGHLVIGTMHASTPEEAIYRLYSAFPADSQNEVRYQLASTLQWLIIQQLVYMDEFKIRVPLLTIVRGTNAIRNTIRENRLNLIEGALQIGRNEGMFTAERYLNDYLKGVRRFTMPTQTFCPSAEAVSDMGYESPLTKDVPVRNPEPSRAMRSADNAPTGKSEFIRGDAGNMLIIDEEASLQDLIRKLEQ